MKRLPDGSGGRRCRALLSFFGSSICHQLVDLCVLLIQTKSGEIEKGGEGEKATEQNKGAESEVEGRETPSCELLRKLSILPTKKTQTQIDPEEEHAWLKPCLPYYPGFPVLEHAELDLTLKK